MIMIEKFEIHLKMFERVEFSGLTDERERIWKLSELNKKVGK
jgi:hypothetical protein